MNRFALFLTMALISAQDIANALEAIDLGAKRELFIDHYLIEYMENARLELQHPQAQAIALKFDMPWEGRYCGYVTVFKDGLLYRMYYRGLPEAGKDGSNLEKTCYAESADGVRWEKPKLGIYEVAGTKENNVVLADLAPFSHNFSPFLDERPDVGLDEKYKALAGVSSTGLHAFISRDGLHWEKRDQVISKGAFDSQNVAFWSESESCYVAYFRTWTEGDFGGYRSISRSTSQDFQNWSEPVAMHFGDTKLEHLYTNQTLPYFRAPHIYIGFAARFMPGRHAISPELIGQIGVEKAYSGDCSDGVLLSTRGGNSYDRTFMEGFIVPGIGAEHWTSRSNYAAQGVVPLDENSLGIYVQEKYGQLAASLRLYKLRTDGFACVVAPYSGGEVLTKPLSFAGSMLKLNAATSAAGVIKVEVLDEAGEVIDGYSLDDSIEMVGNSLDMLCAWKTGKTLVELADRKIRLRIVLSDARIFSLVFE